MRIASLSAVLLLSLSACTFVKMAPGAAQVQVVALGKDMTACEKAGEIEVSVKDRLGPYARDEMSVRDELETLARNEAPALQADVIQPKGEPADGEQRFVAYRCGAAKPRASVKASDSAETVPLKD
jgi:hypothetical protein